MRPQPDSPAKPRSLHTRRENSVLYQNGNALAPRKHPKSALSNTPHYAHCPLSILPHRLTRGCRLHKLHRLRRVKTAAMVFSHPSTLNNDTPRVITGTAKKQAISWRPRDTALIIADFWLFVDVCSCFFEAETLPKGTCASLRLLCVSLRLCRRFMVSMGVAKSACEGLTKQRRTRGRAIAGSSAAHVLFVRHHQHPDVGWFVRGHNERAPFSQRHSSLCVVQDVCIKDGRCRLIAD
jgi:hypothetical protein